jgi:branched-chain amino acid transport system ATP-binding protein
MSAVIDFEAAARVRSVPAAAVANLKVNAIGKTFGTFRAVDGVSLEISRHEVRAVIGPNGAGKSTLFSCLAGTLIPSSGSVRFNGEDVTHLPVQRRVKRGLVKSFQTTSVFPEMSVGHNVMAAALGVARWSLQDLLRTPASRPEIQANVERSLREVRLLDRSDTIASTLSHGEQRRLEIGIAVACGACILLLDEPTAGMGIDDIKDFIDLVGRLRESCGILLVEHNMNIVLGLSDRVTVMAQGKVICEGTPKDVCTDPLVRAAYLGRREV